jgi:ABC-type protease/lipase transport system fused ATPase/permease subunit
MLLVYDLIIATGSLDTLACLAIGAIVCLILDLRLRQARSSLIAYPRRMGPWRRGPSRPCSAFLSL